MWWREVPQLHLQGRRKWNAIVYGQSRHGAFHRRGEQQLDGGPVAHQQPGANSYSDRNDADREYGGWQCSRYCAYPPYLRATTKLLAFSLAVFAERSAR